MSLVKGIRVHAIHNVAEPDARVYRVGGGCICGIFRANTADKHFLYLGTHVKASDHGHL